jgi:RecA-family ATPase
VSPEPRIWTGAELLAEDFPPIPWIIPGFLTSGLTLLVGAPKLGKSWLALAIAFSCSVGGAVLSRIEVPRHTVLYLALEDTARRLQDRLLKIGATPSDTLHIATEWRAGEQGVELLHKWIERHPLTKLIIIDTWGRFSTIRDGNDYAETTAAAAKLKAVADQYDIAIIAVHHARKAEVTDFIDGVLGSTGLAAGADNTMLLKRGRGNREATLSVTGRDIEEAEYVLCFDHDTGTWALEGTTAEVQETNARQEIVDVLTDAAEGMTPKQVAEVLKKNHSTTKNLLWKMANDDVLISLSGVYMVRKPVNLVDRKPDKPETDADPGLQSTEFTAIRGDDEDKQVDLGIF